MAATTKVSSSLTSFAVCKPNASKSTGKKIANPWRNLSSYGQVVHFVVYGSMRVAFERRAGSAILAIRKWKFER